MVLFPNIICWFSFLDEHLWHDLHADVTVNFSAFRPILWVKGFLNITQHSHDYTLVETLKGIVRSGHWDCFHHQVICGLGHTGCKHREVHLTYWQLVSYVDLWTLLNKPPCFVFLSAVILFGVATSTEKSWNLHNCAWLSLCSYIISEHATYLLTSKALFKLPIHWYDMSIQCGLMCDEASSPLLAMPHHHPPQGKTTLSTHSRS